MTNLINVESLDNLVELGVQLVQEVHHLNINNNINTRLIQGEYIFISISFHGRRPGV